MIRHLAALLTLSSVVLGASSTTRADLVVASFTTGPTTVGHSGNSSTTLGWTFTANSNLLVTALGYYDDGANGLAEVHDVGLFNSGGNLLVSATVPSGTGGSLVDRFRYVSISPFTLSAGTYTIGATIGAQASDPVAYNVSGLSFIPAITIPSGASRYTEAGDYTSLTFPNLSFPAGNPYNIYFGPNFQVSAVPEPATAVMLGIGTVSLLVYRWCRRKPSDALLRGDDVQAPVTEIPWTGGLEMME